MEGYKMNDHKIGTLVMLNSKDNSSSLAEYNLRDGMIGEVIKISAEHQAIGKSTVLFPSVKSNSSSGGFSIYNEWLIPLSDPDLDVGDVEQDSEYLKEPEKAAA
jgi:hypothetical protein